MALDVGELLERLQAFEGMKVLENEPMAAHTSFEVGGPAELMTFPRTADEVVQVVSLAREAGVPWRMLGKGSNVIVSDEGVRGIVVVLADNFAEIRVGGRRIVAQAGATNADVATAALAAGLSGYEFASGIPGSIGGAAIMNAGAYDGEFRDVCVSVTCLAPDGGLVEVSREEADWGYRHSRMMDEGHIVLSATLELEPGDPAEIQALMDDLKARREAKQPLEFPSAGSTFKRPTGYFAGKLVQDSGMRGHRVGGAMVSEKHCGFVVNAGGATAADVLQVIRDVQAAVRGKFGVELEPEPRLWGFKEMSR